MDTDVNLSVTIGGLNLQNPVLTASGTFGYGKEFEELLDLNRLGGIVAKGISRLPRPGNKPPRIVETACGMLNAIGLENVGLETFLKEKTVFFKHLKTKVIANILGDSIEDYCHLAERLNEEPSIAALEVNISCPNVKAGGVAFGTSPEMAGAVTRAVRRMYGKTLIVKLSPNVTDIVAIAQAVADEGADGVSLVNTLTGMAIDVQTKKPKLANIVGGLSGPAIKPVALRMVWQVASKVNIPVIGIGGICCTEDALEFLIAGASAIQVGTANFIEPKTAEHIVDGLSDYFRKQKIKHLREIIGSLRI